MSVKERVKSAAVWSRIRAAWRITLGHRERVPIWAICVAGLMLVVAINGAHWSGQRDAERRASERQTAEAAVAASAKPILPPWDQQPTARLTDGLCSAYAVATVDGIDYEIYYHNRGIPSVKLIAVDHNQRAIDAGRCDDLAKGQAQNHPAWDHHTGGCVATTMIDARRYIISAGWGMIVPEPGRLAGPGETPRGACKGDAVPPIEDTAGYAVDQENWMCRDEDDLYVRALRACLTRDQLVPGENGRMRLK